VKARDQGSPILETGADGFKHQNKEKIYQKHLRTRYVFVG
jgi:hypothetical protein